MRPWSHRKLLQNTVRRTSQRGFTLIEVVIALGVFAFAVTIILGLFLRGTSHLSDVEERKNAIQLIPTINASLQSIGWNSDLNGGESGVEELTASGGFALVSNSDASWVTLQTEAEGLEVGDQYYLIFVEQYTEAGHRYGSDLRGVLALKVRISWPYRMPATGGSGYLETDEKVRKTLEFVSTIRP